MASAKRAGGKRPRQAAAAKTTTQTPTTGEPKRKRPSNSASERRGPGRPTAYRAEYCDQVVALGEVGKSKAQIARDLRVDRKTLDNWCSRHPEFREAMDLAREWALAWWEDQGQAGIWAGKEFNSNAYALQVRNRFADEYGRPDSVIDVNLDEHRAAIQRKLDRIASAAGAQSVSR